jgi:predicted dehydrogenase
VDDVAKLADMGLDAVYITTPIPSHFPVAKFILENKVARNLFVEKTLASSYEEAEELRDLAHRFCDVSMVGYTRRFAVTFRKAKDLLAEDGIGDVFSFKAYAYSSDFLGSRKDVGTGASRGGVLRDLGCHALDLALWFFGDFQVQSAELSSINSSSDDSVSVRVEKSNGPKGEFNISWRMPSYRMPEVGLSINGSKGTIEVNDDNVKLKMKDGKLLTWYKHDLNDNTNFMLGGPEYFRENEYFVNSIIERRQAEPSFDTAAKVDEIIDQVKERAE